MNMSAAEVRRSAPAEGRAQPQNSSQTPPLAAKEPNGSQILVRCLQAEGVKFIWGYPGGSVLYIYDALYQQDTIQHVLVRHEQAAVHAADGYARATGDVGVALVTSGPGVTNAVTGIATAYMDSIPMVIITGQVPTPAIGLDAFQECDTVGITRPIVKHNFLVKDVRDLAVTLKKAFHIARTGRPGPVVVDIPKDVSLKTAPFHYPDHVEMRSYNPVKKGHGGQIRKSVQLLLNAKRPYIYTGGGVILGNASAELRELCDLLGYPVTNTLIGNPAHFASVERKIIHIDIDPSSISKRVKVDIPIVGDVKDVLQELIAQVREAQQRPDAGVLSQWWSQINEWRRRECLAYKRSPDVIKPQQVVEALWELTRGTDTYVTSDVGQHQMWAAQYYRFDDPRRWINSGGLGTMGVGLPYAMGIKLAKPDAEVFCITGEGSIQMNIQELSTCQQYKTPVKVIALNNRYLGMVRQWQELDYQGRYSHSYMDALPDFVKLAEAYGHVGLKIEKPSEIEPALKEMLRLKDRTVFLDVRTDPTENVWPMVKAGKGISEMLLGSEDL